jgi:hypothetical protein
MTCLCILYAETRRSEKIQGLSTTFQQIFEFMVYNFSGLRKVGDVLQFYSTKKKKDSKDINEIMLKMLLNTDNPS